VCPVCIDDRQRCDYWAKMGECEKNKKWMEYFCAASCKTCGECSDQNRKCFAWALRGECINNPSYMHRYCACSCLKCSKGLLGSNGKMAMLQPVTSPAPTNKPTQPTNKPVTPTNQPTTKPTKSSLHLNPDICGRRNAPIGISKRIVGGVDAKLQDWPWIGNLRQKSNPKKMCGLSIINQQYVLTAAHCLGMWGYPDKNDYQVRIGESHIGAMQTEASERIYDVEDIILHERYDISTFDNDIALLKIKGKIQYGSAAKPICLPKQGHEFSHSRKCYLAGWGHEKDGGELTKALQEVEMPLIDDDTCEEAFPDSNDQVTVNMICAGHKEGGFDACQGDSGGPLVCDIDGVFYQAGIVSWGEGCGRKDKYGVFTEVSNYRNWIEKSIDTIENAGKEENL